MREMRTRFATLFIGALTLAAALSVAVRAQEKAKETQKPTNTVEAWRQALPPEAETELPAEEAATVAKPRASREEIETGLIALERKWMEALKLRDASALSEIISDDFMLISPRLVIASGERDKYVNHVVRDLSLDSYDLDELKVRLYGRSAVVSSRVKQTAMVAGEDWGGSYLVTDVWVSRDGSWRVVSRHASLLTPVNHPKGK